MMMVVDRVGWFSYPEGPSLLRFDIIEVKGSGMGSGMGNKMGSGM